MTDRPAPIRRRWRRVMIPAALVCLGVCGWLWLAFQRIPDWYDPLSLASQDGDRIRREATSWVDSVSHKIVQQREFSLELHQGELNEVLAGLSELLPDAGRRLPDYLADPMVMVDEDGVRFGVTVRRTYWSCIVTGRLRARLSPDGQTVSVGVEDLRCGTLALPAGLAARLFAPAIGAGPDAAAGMSERGGLTRDWPNRFTWPNGRRDVSITRIEFLEGVVRIGVRPL